MFMVTTTSGVRVKDGGSVTGLPEDQAKASAEDRNARAVELGIQTRYEIRPYQPAGS